MSMIMNASMYVFIISSVFIVERQHSPSVHLVHRSGGMPCWIPFSLAVPGFALRNRFRVVRDLCFTVVEGPLCARQLIFLIQRQGSGDPTPCGGYPGTHCSVCCSWGQFLSMGYCLSSIADAVCQYLLSSIYSGRKKPNTR